MSDDIDDLQDHDLLRIITIGESVPMSDRLTTVITKQYLRTRSGYTPRIPMKQHGVGMF